MKLSPNRHGYIRISLRNEKGKRNFSVHRLVAEYFLPRPTKDQLKWANTTKAKRVLVNHKDGNKLNNHVDNLEWCTNSENVLHSYATGLATAKGENNSQCKLLEIDVLNIRSTYIAKDPIYGAKAMAIRYNVCESTIYSIVKKRKRIN